MHRRSIATCSTKTDACFRSLVSWSQQRGQSKVYPLCVSTPIDETSISSILRVLPAIVRSMVAGLKRGRVLPSSEIFKFPGWNPPHTRVSPKTKLRKRRTQNFGNSEFRNPRHPQTKLRTGRKLPLLYYISYCSLVVDFGWRGGLALLLRNLKVMYEKFYIEKTKPKNSTLHVVP